MRALFFLFIFCLITPSCWGEGLKVGAVKQTPFVVKTDGEHSGIAVDLWDSIAKELGEPYTLVEYSEEDMKNAFHALHRGDIDLLIGALPMTRSNLEMADFSIPFYVDKVVPIVMHDYTHNLVLVLKMMFFSFAWILGIFLTLYILYIYFLWYYEGEYISAIPKGSRHEGVFYLFWKDILIGRHGDEIPKTLQGKALIFLRLIFSYFLLALFTSLLISSLTVSLSKWTDPIQYISDLEGRKIGVLAGSKPSRRGEALGLKMESFKSMKAGITALEERKIGAFLADFSLADAYLRGKDREKVQISHFVLKEDLHAFATRPGNPLLRKINEQMLTLRKNGVTSKICKSYLEKGVKDCDL